jgi:hypothetical protein
LHRIAARLRFLLNPKSSGWAANGDWRRYVADKADWLGANGCREPNARLQPSANIQAGRPLSDAPVYFFDGAPNHRLEEDREDG